MSLDPHTIIVTAALAQVREEGLDSLSVRSVATRANYSPAGLYRHFESIDELRTAISYEVCAEFKAYLWERLAVEPTSAAAAQATAEWVDANPQVGELILQCTADKFMKVGDDRTWFSFAASDAPEEQKMRVAILGWDILRSLLYLRTFAGPGFDYKGMFASSTEFLRESQNDGLI